MTALRFSEGQPFDRVERVVKPRRASSGPEETVSPPTILRHRTSLSSVSFLIIADTRLFATTNRSKMSRPLSKGISQLSTRGQVERRRPPFLRGPTKPKEVDKNIGGKMDSTASIISGTGDRLSDEDLSPDILVRQNYELRHRLEEEAANYKRRLDTYRQAQQHQAALVSRLQAKVLQYKQRCSELENQMTESPTYDTSKVANPTSSTTSALDAAHQTLREMREEQIHDLDTAVKKLGDERKRCEKLLQINTTLKDQLDESHQTNEALTNDLQKLSNEWDILREELAMKEEEWREEEQAFNEYYTSEHNRLLNLWRDVVSVKRLFADIKSSTERDLLKMKNSIISTFNDVSSACNSTGFAIRMQTAMQPMISHQAQQAQEQVATDLKTELGAIRQQYSVAQNEIRVKEEKINQLIRDVHSLEERCGEAEAEMHRNTRLQDDIEILQSALRDIAHAVIQDAESREMESTQAPPHLHLSPTGPIPQRSPKRGTRGNTIPAFAESTISAVQAALHKYQLTIHELQVKLQTNKEQLHTARRQCESAEENVKTLERRADELINELDAARSNCSQLVQEKDMLQKSHDTVRIEKNALDKSRVEVNSMMENLNSDCEKLQKANNKLQKLCDNLEDEKLYLQSELSRVSKDVELRELNLRSEEDRCSKMREELLTLREELSKTYLAKDMLEQQKLETDGLISQIEKSKGDLELDLERVLLEKSDVQEVLIKLETVCSNHEKEKERLHEELKKVTDEKNKLANQCADQQGDLGSLRKELLQTEQTRLDLESEKVTLNEKVKFMEIEKEKIEIELAQATRERGDLSNQLSVLARKKESLNEELMRLRQRLEQANEMNGRINRNLEDLVKDNEEKQVLLETNEKEVQRLQEQVASMRSEKETLEGVLFDTQTNLENMHIKKTQLEKEQKELLVKQESLKGQVERLVKELENSEKRAQEIKQTLTQQSGDQEAEFHQIVSNIKKHNEDSVKKLNDEKEQIKINLEKRLQQSLLQLSGEKDNDINQLQQRIEEMQQHIENLCQQHEEVLLRAENDKQQALLIAHHDQQALMEKLEGVLREMEEEKNNVERVKREAAARAEQERNNSNQLRDEFNRLKTKLDESKLKADEEKIKLDLKIEELWKERESAQRESEELQVQLHMTEDRVDSLQNQLHDTIRKLKDAENVNETLRKELVDTRRQLADSTYEKDKYNSSNKELREHVKRIESEKREQSRTLEESYQKIAALEDMKVNIDAERSRLQAQLREMEREILQLQKQVNFTRDELQKSQQNNAQAHNDEKELQARLTNETEERERLQLQLHQVKKQLVDVDNSLKVTRQELGRLRSRTDEEDERWRTRDQELVVRLEDSRCRERKLEDQKHNLEVCLADASQQIQELKARLGGSEGRVRALDAQLSQLEMAKKDIEQKLCSVASTLRRIAGIQMDGSVNMPFKLMSPSRRWSPARAQDHIDSSRDAILDVDPEAVRKGVRSLMQQVAQIERERDDCNTELCSLKKQLTETQEVQNKSDMQINTLLTNMRILQDEKNSLEVKLSQKQSGYDMQLNALQQKTDECEQLREKMTNLELMISSSSEEKVQYEEKLDRLKHALNKVENEKRNLQEELSRSESRATKLELQRMSLEGDLQRLQMMFQEKDANIHKLQERNDMQCRAMASLEERCASLKSTVEQLHIALEKASNTESELKNEINSLQHSIMELTATLQASNEKNKQVQKQLSNAENERRILSERVESLQQSLSDLKHTNQTLTEQITRLQNELANNEVQRCALESQLRLVTYPQEESTNKGEEILRQLQTAQRERSEMRGKVEALNDKVKLLEADKRNLERQLALLKSTNRSKSYERPEKAHVELLGTSFDTDHYEQENRELRLKVRRLETQLAEKEAELIRVKSSYGHTHSIYDFSRDRAGEIERLRAAQLQAEKLLEAREQSHRQQVLRLENQIQLLREQLNQEIKRRQLYVLRSSRAGREMQQLRQALGDSLRTVAQDPSLDAVLLEHEARKLDSTLTSTTSLPPSLALPPPSSYDRSSTPVQLK